MLSSCFSVNLPFHPARSTRFLLPRQPSHTIRHNPEHCTSPSWSLYCTTSLVWRVLVHPLRASAPSDKLSLTFNTVGGALVMIQPQYLRARSLSTCPPFHICFCCGKAKMAFYAPQGLRLFLPTLLSFSGLGRPRSKYRPPSCGLPRSMDALARGYQLNSRPACRLHATSGANKSTTANLREDGAIHAQPSLIFLPLHFKAPCLPIALTCP